MKEHISEKDPNKGETSNLSNKEFKVTIIKMLTKFRRMDRHSVNFNKVLENIKEDRNGAKIIITAIKDLLAEINSRLDTEEQISHLEDRLVKLTRADWKKKKN